VSPAAARAVRSGALRRERRPHHQLPSSPTAESMRPRFGEVDSRLEGFSEWRPNVSGPG
jgi:hypothetical protein